MPLPWPALPGLILTDRVGPAWDALTPEQQTCWQFWAAAHPRITQDGDLRTLVGWQEFYATNSLILLSDTPTPITDPPSNNTPPIAPRVIPLAWRKQARIQNTSTSRYAYAGAYIDHFEESNTALVFTQTYRRQKKNPRVTTGTRHVRYVEPSTTGEIPFQNPNGYYSSTGGNTKYARIKGRTAIRRPDLPLAKMYVINLDNGEVIETTLSNPTGGARKTIRRPLHYP